MSSVVASESVLPVLPVSGAPQPATSVGGEEARPTFNDLLQRLADGADLTREQAAAALSQIVDHSADEVQAAAFLMGLRAKGETAEEIAGLADAMRVLAVPVVTAAPETLVDIVGTGGDRLGTFNISTTAALVVAGAGVRVAKHGNRAASSLCGAADVLQALQVRVDLGPAEVVDCIESVGIGFMLASLYHPSMSNLAGVRRSLGIRTVFNFLGPITNPAGAQRMLLGVSAEAYLEVLAGALARTGCRHALLVCGDQGMDELSVTGPSTMLEVRDGRVGCRQVVDPVSLGLQRYPLEALAGAGPEENAGITRDILAGRLQGGPREAVLLNAGAALYVAGAAPDMVSGIASARESIDSGRALQKLEQLAAFTNRQGVVRI